METTTEFDEVTVSFPATSGYLALCRVNVTTMAGVNGFDVDALDDLRLAVTEGVNWLLHDEDGLGTVSIVVRARPGRVEFDAERRPPGPADDSIDDLAGAILGATVDEVEVAVDGERRTIKFVKTGAVDL